MYTLDSEEKKIILDYTKQVLAPIFNMHVADFNNIPLLDKKNSLPFYNLPVTNGTKSYSSTGTSGNPKKIHWSDKEDEWYIADKRKIIVPFLSECKRIFISLGLGHGSGTSPFVFADSSIEVLRVGVEDIHIHIKKLEKFMPDSLYCSPSLLVSLIKNCKKQNIALHTIKKIILNGEVVYDSIIGYFCDELNIHKQDILDTYGSTEIGTIAYTCHLCGKYHFMPGIIPESIPAKNISDSLPVNEEILILTSLKRTSFPVVRFVTYDLVRGLSKTICNNKTFYSYDRIIGRSDDVLNYGELLPATDIINLIKEYYPEKDYLIFNYYNQIDILIEGKENNEFRNKLYNTNPMIKEMIADNMLESFHIYYYKDLAKIRGQYSIPRSPSKEGLRIIKQKYEHPINS